MIVIQSISEQARFVWSPVNVRYIILSDAEWAHSTERGKISRWAPHTFQPTNTHSYIQSSSKSTMERSKQNHTSNELTMRLSTHAQPLYVNKWNICIYPSMFAASKTSTSRVASVWLLEFIRNWWSIMRRRRAPDLALYHNIMLRALLLPDTVFRNYDYKQAP